MEKNAVDRRVRRTHRLLKESLLSLMKEKRLSDITVADIAERADVNRATFYLHFSNPAHLLQSIGDDLLEKTQTIIEDHRDELVGGDTLRPLLDQILDVAIASKDLWLLLFSYEQESQFTEKLLKLIQKQGTEIVKAKSGICPENDIPYFVDFITCGLIGMIRTWFYREMDISKKELLDAADLLTDGAASRFMNELEG